MYRDPEGAKCGNRTIASHSIQKGGPLKAIAEGSHVYGLKNELLHDEPGFHFHKIGISKASIFPGYCKKHDREFFSEIENGQFDFNPRNFALVMARSIARDIFTKSGQLRLYSSEEVQKIFYNKIGREDYDTMMAGTVMAKQELHEVYNQIVDMVHSDKYSDLVYICFEFQDTLPFCFSGSFTPEHTIDGRHILPEHLDPWNVFCCFCGNIGRRNFFLIGTSLGQADDKLLEFLCGLEKVTTTASDFALNFGLEYAENFFFKPSWIDRQNPILKESILRKMHSGLHTQPDRQSEGLFEFRDLVSVATEKLYQKVN